MSAKIFRINYKSDFIATLHSDAGWMTPFCIKFWTGAPSQAYFVGWDGTTYTNCSYDPSEPTKLVVQFDDHHLPIGNLKYQIAYHFTVADFPDDTEDEVINAADVMVEIDGDMFQVMLDFTGETAPEIQFSLPAYANEAQRIANEQERIANEEQRIADEQTRISNEETRINQEQDRQNNESQRIRNEQTRINQEEARVREFAKLKQESDAATTAANNAAALANQKAQLAADKAQLAADKATLAQSAATLANNKAQLADNKAQLAAAAAQLANDKAALAQQKAEFAQTQGAYAKEQGDYAKDQGIYAERQGDYAKNQGDYAKQKGDAASEAATLANQKAQAANDAATLANQKAQAADDAATLANQKAQLADQKAQAADDAAAAALAAKTQMESRVQQLIENTDALLGAEDVPNFSTSVSYVVGDMVMYDGKLYKFIEAHPAGAWIGTDAVETNLFNEIEEMVKSDYEQVIITLKTEEGAPLPNVEVVVTVEGEEGGRNLTTDAQGRCTTNVQKGLEYVVSCANVPNYFPVNDIVRRASLPIRYVEVTYEEDDTLTRETVKITVGYSDPTLPKATWVRISYGGENYQLALNDHNIAETTVRLGTVYTVSFEDIDGYKTPSPQTYTASLHGTRNINVSYVAPVAGLKWLMANNTERELNDVSDLERINGDIFGLIVQTSDLMAAGCSFVIPLPFLLTQSATGTGQWLSANVTVPQLNYFGSLQAALADFDGDANCAAIEQFIVESAQQGTTYTSSMVSNCRGRVGGAPSFDDTENYEAGDYVVYRNYLHLFLVDHAAGPWVEGETQQMTGFLMPDGVVRKCFSPAFAQIYAFRLLRDKVNEFTTSVFGIGSCNIASGYWWSSTQCNANNGVSLSNGGFGNNYGKNGNCGLLPVLAY